ncbi:U3 small nucleolar RNA-associated protein 11 [Polychaeton citri CBS 116435]|uniref:U3 small nucleolar RNA-associated protein 11 n=1 Tax=Polychaeton citri CBS 116435 TaxID=1314669 RepID=A0A9P4Q1B5_9PEZI|nr:U3 small nucleolar RNA-associated protein 11 [Polychaeton citri CBS 116435]
MSSMRNAVQRRNHKERAQPLERQKWGLLEKHKDYSLRAKDHNEKKRKLNALKQKASERNEDEFYFGMMSGSSKKGVKRAKRGEENNGGGGTVLSQDVVKLMKTQDVGYLRTVLQQTKRERSRVERDVIAGDVGITTKSPSGGAGRTVFDEDGQVVQTSNQSRSEDSDDDNQEDFDITALAQMAGFDPMAPLDDGSEEDESASGKDEATDVPLSKEKRAAAKKKRSHQDAKRRYLEALEDRERDIQRALAEVEEQRAKMNGTTGGVNKNGTKFRVRQRRK